MMKKLLLSLICAISLLGVSTQLCGCAALWVTGAVAAGATAYDLAAHRECPYCKKLIDRKATTCPHCGKKVAPPAQKEPVKK